MLDRVYYTAKKDLVNRQNKHNNEEKASAFLNVPQNGNKTGRKNE